MQDKIHPTTVAICIVSHSTQGRKINIEHAIYGKLRCQQLLYHDVTNHNSYYYAYPGDHTSPNQKTALCVEWRSQHKCASLNASRMQSKGAYWQLSTTEE